VIHKGQGRNALSSGLPRLPSYKYPGHPPSPPFSAKVLHDKPTMQYQLGAFSACVAVFVYVILRRQKKYSAIRDVQGPVNPSWLFGTSPGGQPAPPTSLFVDDADHEHLTGHQWYFQAGEAGAADKRFLEDYGNIVRWNGPFGVRLIFFLRGTRVRVQCSNS